MKTISIVLIAMISLQSFGQSSAENRILEFDSLDLEILQKADSILSDKKKWNKLDDRECDDDIANEKYSLFCSLYKASIDITGEYKHRRSSMQLVRFTLEKYENGRVINHRLMDWNNHPDTTFEEIKKVLKESINEIKNVEKQ
jgi:hypothetical protein